MAFTKVAFVLRILVSRGGPAYRSRCWMKIPRGVGRHRKMLAFQRYASIADHKRRLHVGGIKQAINNTLRTIDHYPPFFIVKVRKCRHFDERDRKSTRLNSSHVKISYA